MKKTQLSSSEIQDLINRYRSERKKLEFQVSEVDITIAQLENTLKNVSGSEKAALSKRKTTQIALVKSKTKKKRGRPSKKAPFEKKVVLRKKAGRPKKVAKSNKLAKKAIEKKGYKLSPWDTLVVNSIKDAGKVRITQEIIDYVGAKLKESGKSVNDVEVKNKVIRSLQKLANRRGDLKKVHYPGKGFAYAIPDWMGESGKLNKEYKR